jgi:hypothetical protein
MRSLLLFPALALALAACADQTPTGTGVPSLPPPWAGLGVADVTCVGTEPTTFTPGLLLTTQTGTIHSETHLDNCVSTSDPTLTSGSAVIDVTVPLSCLNNVTVFGPRTETITWNNGQSSTLVFAQEVSAVVGVQFTLTSTGTVTSGEFAGKTAIEQRVGPTPNLLDCLAPPGVTSRTHVVVLVIT